RALWDHVARLRDEGRSVLLTTNYLDEAAALCDRVAIIDHGQLIVCEEPGALRREGGVTVVLTVETAGPLDAMTVLLSQHPSVAEVTLTDHSVRARLDEDSQVATVIAMAQTVAPLASVRVIEPSLEDVFLKVTGREL